MENLFTDVNVHRVFFLRLMFFFLLIVPELKFAVYLISCLEKKIILLLIHEKK